MLLEGQCSQVSLYKPVFTLLESQMDAQDRLDDHVEIDHKPLQQDDYDHLSVKISMITE